VTISRLTDDGVVTSASRADARRRTAHGRARIAVFRALQLGDLLCAVPALRALRAAHSGAHVTLVGLPWAREFVDRYARYIDGFLEFPGHPGLPEQPFRAESSDEFLSAVRAHRFDIAIQMHGSGEISNTIVAGFGARRTFGFCPSESPPPCDGFLPYPVHLSEIRRHLALMTHLGFPARGEALEFPARPADHRELENLPAATRLTRGPVVCLHAGGRTPARRWALERFAAVGDALAYRGLSVVLTGSEGERGLTARVRESMTAPAIDLAGRTSLGAMAALLRRARLLVSNDTGVAHLGEAVGVPSVVLFAASEISRWAPHDRRRHRVVSPVESATPSQVLAEADALLGSPVTAAAAGVA
jgi:ADP-heptose:LPS heptosyltransferase